MDAAVEADGDVDASKQAQSKQRVPPLKDMAEKLEKIKGLREAAQPGSQRCEPQTSPLDGKNGDGGLQGSARRRREEVDSLASLKNGMQ